MKDLILSRSQWLRRLSGVTHWKTMLLLLVLCVGASAHAQNMSVSGTVSDATGEPLIGATVQVQGTQNATATDIDGNFTLNNVSPTGVLNVSFIGYKTANVQVNGQPIVNVTLEEDSEVLDEVVVVGYGTMKKSDLTGSVASVGTEKLNAKGAASVLENLQGTTPGVNISKSNGRTNGGVNIEIRGKSSIQGGTGPIYVVDGVISNDIDFLNPQDIERIDVLKDASSTAIYGSRATNGVIIVTTKGGMSVQREQPASISYDGYYGVAKAAHLPDLMDGQEFYNYRLMKFSQTINEISSSSPLLAPQNIYGFQPADNGLGQALLQKNSADWSSPYVLKELLAKGQTYDWPNLVLRNGRQQNHYLSVNGASTNTSYHFGIGINDEKGLYEGDASTTYSFKGSVDTRINKVISAGFNVNMAYTENTFADDDAIGKAWEMNPFIIPYNAEGQIIQFPGLNTAYDTDKHQFSGATSPLLLMKNSYRQKKTYRMIGNAYLQLDLFKGFNVKTTFSPSFTHYRDGKFDGYENPNSPGKTYDGKDLDSSTTTVQNHTVMSWIWDNIATYQTTIGKDHSINAMALFSMESSNSEDYKWIATGTLQGADWYNMQSGITDNIKSKSNYSEGSMMSYALRLNYGFKGKYLLTATIRRDGSSKFADGYRWGSFPSAAVAWRASEESFLKKYSWLSNLKVRLAYGVTGNNSVVGNYDTWVGIGGPAYYPWGGLGYLPGYWADGISDKSLTWETSKEFNVGLDFGFLNNRISGTIDWYQKNSHDLLYEVTLPLETGGVDMYTNIGKVKNTGIEIALTTVNIENRDWNWTTSFTFAHNKNKVKEINGISNEVIPTENYATKSLFIGKSVNNVYEYVWGGVVNDLPMVVPDNQAARDHGFTPGETVRACDYYYNVYGLSEGRAIVTDVNGDGVIDESDRIVRSADPNWTGSFTSSLSYRLPKNYGEIDFGFSLYTRQGGYAYSPFMAGDLFKTSDRGWQKVMLDYYIPAGTLVDADGVNADGTYVNPVYQTQTHYGKWPYPNATVANGATSESIAVDKWDAAKKVVDPSFVKVKNITLGYTFSKNILKHIGCKHARIYFTVTNPFVWTKYKGFDPEWANASVKNDGPSTVTYQVGASLKF